MRKNENKEDNITCVGRARKGNVDPFSDQLAPAAVLQMPLQFSQQCTHSGLQGVQSGITDVILAVVVPEIDDGFGVRQAAHQYIPKAKMEHKSDITL